MPTTNTPTALAEPMAALIVSLADGYDTFVAPATTSGKNVMPRVAALLDVMQVSDIIAVDRRRHVQAPDLCRQRHPDGQSTDAKKVITVRTASFDAAGEGGSASVESVSPAGDPGLSSFVKRLPSPKATVRN
jgi:electron transfer flavoprotein alpha subunit